MRIIKINMNLQKSAIDLNFDFKCQLIIIGDSTVGKTSLLFRYNNLDNPLKQVATVGVDYLTKDVVVDNKVIRTKIWDTAGQERFRSITDNFYKNANGVVLVFDLNSKESFDNLKSWIQSINLKVSSKNVKKILIGNKLDLKREVDENEAKYFAETFGLDYFETSVKNNSNIQESFNFIIEEIFKSGVLKDTKNIARKENSDPGKKKGCC